MPASKNFWTKLSRPILALAPMAGISDSPFRQICKKFGASLVYSEMASATALVYNPKATLKLLEYKKIERPYIVQLFGNNPEHFAIAVKIITKEIKPDGIDINLGCPVKKIIKQGAGSALMKDFGLARKVIEAVIKNTNLPVSIKTRTAVGKYKLIDFLKTITDLDIKALMIHGRTFSQGFVGAPDLKVIKEARQYFKGIILANGGINCYNDIKIVLKDSGADGVGIARGALGNPFIFKSAKPKWSVIKKTAWAQAQLAYKQKGIAGLKEMRRHLAAYVNGQAGASKLRNELVLAESLKEIKLILAIK